MIGELNVSELNIFYFMVNLMSVNLMWIPKNSCQDIKKGKVKFMEKRKIYVSE